MQRVGGCRPSCFGRLDVTGRGLTAGEWPGSRPSLTRSVWTRLLYSRVATPLSYNQTYELVLCICANGSVRLHRHNLCDYRRAGAAAT